MRTRTLSRNKLSRVMWAGGAAAAVFLIVASWLACYSLSREVADVRGRLQAANQDLAVVRAEKQIEEDRQNISTGAAELILTGRVICKQMFFLRTERKR